MTQVQTTTEEIGTMHGQRGIRFNFTMQDDSQASITFDFYGNGRDFNGAPYARCEAAALRAMVTAGYEVKIWSHFIIH
jgi:hypothetical protein